MLTHVKLARVNTLLLVAIVLINGYIILLPLYPKVLFWAQKHDTARVRQLTAQVEQKPGQTPDSRPQDNRLVIPSMVFDQPINEGRTIRTLRQGLWRLPKSSTPDKASNTVIVGHRLTYTHPQAVLYNLDKVRIGDTIAIWWHQKRYRYSVIQTKVVHPDETAVESPTGEPTLTIYTCTPLWLPKDRLVVVARLENIE